MSEQKTHFRDGAVVLYRREGSSLWQARMKIGRGKGSWKRISTKETNINKASEIACREYDRIQFRIEEGFSPETKSFEGVAKLVKEDMEKKLMSGEGKVIYETYINCLEKYHIPILRKKKIDTITYQDIMKFDDRREEILGHLPSKTTVRTHNASLRMVFNFAVKNGWMKPEQIPPLSSAGIAKKVEVRSYLTKAEYHTLYTHMNKYCVNAKGSSITKKNSYLRELLYDYVRFLVNTGMRPGTETKNLKFSDISFGRKGKRKFLKMRVSGKTGEREIVARDNTLLFLRNIASRFDDLKDLKDEELFKVSQPVFRLRNGEQPLNLNKPFKRCLSACGLLEDGNGNNRTLYSLRHSYITWGLLDGISIHLLSKQCGTSINMIEKHYSHVVPMLQADILAGWDTTKPKKNTNRNK